MSDLELKIVRALAGPNIWARVSVLEAELHVGLSEHVVRKAIPSVRDRIRGCLPSLESPPESLAHLAETMEPVSDGAHLADLIVELSLALHSLVGPPVSFRMVRPGAAAGDHHLVVEYSDEDLARPCLQAAKDICLSAIHGQPYDLGAELKHLRSLADDVCLGPSTRAIVQAALARGIPVRRLTEGSLVQLGHGARQRRVCAGETNRTGAIAEMIACDKRLTKELLAGVGVPVPEGRLVADANEACQVANELGGPVVVKPINGNHGRAVFIGLTRREEIAGAYAAAEVEGDGVLVERCVSGSEHRLLVVGESVVAATRGDPLFILGDGTHSVADLVAEMNKDPRRGEGFDRPLSLIEFDPPNLAMLANQGYSTESVPKAGVKVLLQRNGNLSVDVTDLVHPDNAATAVLAAKTVGLDVAGIDLVADDISRPLRSQGGAIVEVNAGPGLQMHLQPSKGTPRPVGEHIINALFPPGFDGRIPIIAVDAADDGPACAAAIAARLHAAGSNVGLASSDGIFYNNIQLSCAESTGHRAAAGLLLHPLIETAVFETPDDKIVAESLGFDRCQLAVISGVSVEPQALESRRALAGILDSRGALIIDAATPDFAGICAASPAPVVVISATADAPALTAHLQAGGRAVAVRGTAIVGFNAGAETALGELSAGSDAGHAAAAAAAAWMLAPAG